MIAPVTMHIDDLSGAHVELVMDQVLNINTDNTGETNYAVEISDPTVVEFSRATPMAALCLIQALSPLRRATPR